VRSYSQVKCCITKISMRGLSADPIAQEAENGEGRMAPDFSVHGKPILITGGAGRIGSAFARAFAAAALASSGGGKSAESPSFRPVDGGYIAS
jgi:hypothetical protein